MEFVTAGDMDLKTSLSTKEGTDFFTREIEAALLNGAIDVAVHSAKDLPHAIPAGLKIAAITKGIESRDALVLRKGITIGRTKLGPVEDLPAGFIVGTSSQRRKEQILKARPDIKVRDIRGAVDERVKQLDGGKYGAIIIAAAGLIRLGMTDRISAYLDIETAHLQGKLAIEARENDIEAVNIASEIDDRPNWGKVHLVGAGPGNAELISVKGARLLKECKTVVYDSLSGAGLLDGLNCEKIFAGKRKGSHHMEQEEINSLLVRLALSGRDTVRLKGGDPVIFGRGLEEADYLKRYFVQYDIVPGITAALAASSYAEIPLTKRGSSSYVTLSTGFPQENIFIPGPGYKGTVVYYMAASTVKNVAELLIKNGSPEKTPAALVSNAGSALQKTHTGTLKSFTQEKEYDAPAVFIAGEAAVKNGKSWHENEKKILFTGTTPERYRHLGELECSPMIELKGLIKTISAKSIKKYGCIVFTSKHGVKYFFEAFNRAGSDSRALSGKKIFSVGSVTSAELEKHGIKPDIQAVFETAQGLLDEFKKRKIRGENVLLPCSALSYDTLGKGLSALGNRVKSLIVYENIMPEHAAQKDLTGLDAIVFTSPSCVKNFKKIYGSVPAGLEIITTGRITKEAAVNEKIQASQG